MTKEIIEIIGVGFLSSVKFLFSPFTAVALGFSFQKTIIVTSIGGIVGVLFFYFGGVWFFEKLAKLNWKKKSENQSEENIKKEKRNRRLLKIIDKYGMFGVAALSPVLISIPIGAVIASKYFNKNPFAIIYLIVGVLFWSVVLTGISVFLKQGISLITS